MSTLNTPTVELVSTLRVAGENGPLNSADYNDSWTEALADLASLAGFINDFLIPMMNGLDATIQPNSQNPPSGLEGRFIFGDTTDTTPLFYDSLDNEALTIADSLRLLNGISTSVQAAIQNINVEITALQSQLSTNNQNDIAQALQNFAATLQSLTDQTNSNTSQLEATLISLQTNGTANAVQNLLNLENGSGIMITNSSDSGNVVIATDLPEFQTNGTANTTQDVLNLVAGDGVTLTADSDGDVTITSSGGAGITLETNGTSNSDQTLLNVAAGTNVTITNSSGTTTINATSGATDEIIHGDALWEIDPAYIYQRDDFLNGALESDSVYGDLLWSPTGTFGNLQVTQMGPPYLGILAATNTGVQNEVGSLFPSNSSNYGNGYALFDYPSWKYVWVFGFNPGYNLVDALPANPFSMNSKTMYVGLRDTAEQLSTARPCIFLGLRYDTDTTSPTINDTTMKFEVVLNTVNNSRNNTQGTTYDTTWTPISGSWYRFEMECTTANGITMTLYNGSSSVSNTFTVPQYSQAITSGADSGIKNGVFYVSDGSGQPPLPVSAGTIITFSGCTNATALNGNQVVVANDNIITGLISASDVAIATETGSMSFYPGLIPFITWGNNSTTSSPIADSAFLWDFYSFAWNPGVGGGSGTPNVNLPRYW